VEVTDALVAVIPEDNIRVALDEFADMWRAAERWYGVWMPNPANMAAVSGIGDVCRWLATVTDMAPVTRRPGRAHPAAIEAEIEAIQEAIDAEQPPEWSFWPPGWGKGVIASFTWAWLGGDLPLYCFEFADDMEHGAR
jgi:hypothetical protein